MQRKPYEELLKDYEEKGIIPQAILIQQNVNVQLSECPYCNGLFYVTHSDIHCPYCCMELIGKTYKS